MNRIDLTFEKCRAENRKAVVPYLCAGDPDLETTEQLIIEMANNGADIIEIGVPFSDPMADGPSIQAACQRSLDKGTTLKKIIAMVRRIREKTEVALVLFSYYNVLFKYGFEQLAADAAEAGIDGMLIVDVPFEEREEVLPALKANGLHFINLLAPTTPEDRAEMILKEATGFVYCITVTGITGARTELPADLAERLERIRQMSPAPIVAGFGISSGEMAARIAPHADGVVVGSAFVNRLAKAESPEQGISDSLGLLEELAAACRA